MAKNKKPARIYEYGAQEPVENLSLVEDNLYKYHKLKNDYVALVLWLRRVGNLAIETGVNHPIRAAANKVKQAADALDTLFKQLQAEKRVTRKNHSLITQSSEKAVLVSALREFEQAVNDFAPDNNPSRLAEISQEIEKLKAEIEALKAEHKQRNMVARKKTKQPDIEAAKKAAKLRLKSLYETHRAIKASETTGNDSIWTALNILFEERWKACYAGHYDGYYNLAKDDAQRTRSGRPPKLKRWDGSGKTGQQIKNGGISVEELYSCKNNNVRLEVISTKRKKTKAVLWLRIGSNNRQPVWTKVPITMHRPLPGCARVQRVILYRYRIGTKAKWSVQFTLSGVPAKVAPAKRGVVGVDIGWRNDGGIRAAYWTGSDGQQGELLLPDINARLDKCDELKSLRDERFNEIKDMLARDTLPEWLREETQNIHAWKNPARLAKLVHRWRENRYDGDEHLFARVEAWRVQDKHLLEWEANQRASTLRHRLDYYRKFAAGLAKQYKYVVLEDIDLREFAKLPGDDEYVVTQQRLNRVRAALSILRQAIRDSGMSVIEAEREYPSSKMCHCCGHVNQLDSGQLQTCGECHESWDRDHNAATNLMRYGIDKVRREGSGVAA